MTPSPMAAEAIANYDSFVWVALGLFVSGLLAVMVYERSSSKAKSKQQHQRSGTTPADANE